MRAAPSLHYLTMSVVALSDGYCGAFVTQLL